MALPGWGWGLTLGSRPGHLRVTFGSRLFDKIGHGMTLGRTFEAFRVPTKIYGVQDAISGNISRF